MELLFIIIHILYTEITLLRLVCTVMCWGRVLIPLKRACGYCGDNSIHEKLYGSFVYYEVFEHI